MDRRLVVFVLIMVVLAGCANGQFGQNTTNPQNNSTENKTIETESSSGQENGSNGTDSANSDSDESGSDAVSPDNPWGERTLTVAIDNELDNDRQFQPLVADALAYWEQNSKQYAGYPIEYTLTDSAENADVIISFAPSIEQCGEKRRVEGCAPYITSSTTLSRPAEVQIKGGYTDDSTRQLLIHELGHTLGLDHDDRPKQIMAAESDLTELPQPDVTERALPWNHSTLTVAVDLSTVPIHKRKAVNKQINTALDYYDRGAGGTVPEQVSFKRVSNPKNADIFITFSDSLSCGIQSGSCSKSTGINRDSDDALEQYVRVTIMLSDIDTNTVAWHVGNRLGADGFGFDHPTDFPQPLRSHTPLETRKSQWWR